MHRRHWPLIAFPLAKLAIHLGTYRGYGMFRDEFYYLACADHLAWGYVDHPPLSIFALWMVRGLLGDSLLAVRLLPALAGAATVLLVGLLARRLRGGPAAQSLAMVALIAAPVHLGLDHFYSMNALDLLFWALAAYLLVGALEREDRRSWLLLGGVLGLGLLNKISVLWLGFGILVGLLATDRRRVLRTPGPWLAGGLAGLLFLPHLIWQVANGWPTLEFIRNATENKMVHARMLDFLESQFWMMNPATLAIWAVGLGWLLFVRAGRPYRILGIVYVAVLVLLLVNGASRAGYLAPAYAWLLAAGGVAWESMLLRSRARSLLWVGVGALAVVGAILAPLALPVLPVETYIDYAAALGSEPSTEERKELAALPQFYADMHGWEAIVETVAEVYAQLSPEEQALTAIYTNNYGDAGAITYLGKRYGLPAAIGGHNNYFLWGPGRHTGEVMIAVGSDREDLEPHFESVELGAVIDCGHCMPYENHRPVWICRKLNQPWAELWPTVKHYD